MSTQPVNLKFYRQLSLIDLVRLIVDKSDRQALDELHHRRPLFYYRYERGLLLIAFIDRLRQAAEKRKLLHPDPLAVTEKAFDLTVDKFFNMPTTSTDAKSNIKETEEGSEAKGADCILYFRAFLRCVAKSFHEEPPIGPLEEESRAAGLLVGMVKRQFFLSMLEAMRACHPFWSRYTWKIQGREISVSLPVSIGGLDRPKWLEENIGTPDLNCPGERKRIQTLIDQSLARKERFVAFDDLLEGVEETLRAIPDSGREILISIPETIIQAVTEEVCQNIDLQRTAIRDFGPIGIKHMIREIFRARLKGFSDVEIARMFGLSKSTYSRFAGSEWGPEMPDLWEHTAHVVSTHQILREHFEGTSIWDRIQELLEPGAEGPGRQPRRGK